MRIFKVYNFFLFRNSSEVSFSCDRDEGCVVEKQRDECRTRS